MAIVMTEDEAITAANGAAQGAGANLEDFRAPEARRDQGEWVVWYHGKKLLVGNFFFAVVDDRLGGVRLVAGA